MMTYHKIATVFERDTNGTKLLIEGQFRNPTIEFLKNNPWEFTEKINGTNIRIGWDGHTITFGGRTERAKIPVDLMNYLTRTFLNPETEELFEQKFGETPVIFFGEGYGPKIQKDGGLYRDDPSFIMFDAFCNGVWLERRNVEGLATVFGIDAVPIVLTGTIDEAVQFVKTNPKSTIGSAMMEGVVGRPKVEVLDRRGNRLIVKIKVQDFIK